MSMNRHEDWEELVSASLTDDLGTEERARLDAHLDGCAACRATLAAFADQRRMVAGVRHVPPPRDLGARVRAGIEGGSRVGLPWWRRPMAVFAGVGGGLAVVAGALLALVIMNGSTDEPQVGESSPSPSTSFVAATGTPAPTLPAAPASPAQTPSATPDTAQTPSPTPVVEPEPDVYLAVTGPFDNQMMTVRHGPTGETIMELGTSAVPIAAELSPDGQWLAYITEGAGSGINTLSATRIAEGTPSTDPEAPPPLDPDVPLGETVILGESVAGGPFLEQLAWSSNSHYLAYTLADPGGAGTDAWIFEPGTEPYRLTDSGNAYAGSWIPGSAGSSLLWVSVAGPEPVSHLLSFHDSAGGADLAPIDPSADALASWPGAFQPLVSPNGGLVIYWRGRMEQAGAEWLFGEGAAPYLGEHRYDGEESFEARSERQLFSDLLIGRSAFASAALAWGPDSDAYAVWGVQWTGTSQGPDGILYPDEGRVYFGHAADPRGLTRLHAIDEDDIPEGWRAIDVKVAPTGHHLVVSVAQPRAGVLDTPVADLLLIRRNTGDVADEVFTMNTTEGWFGPAAFDALTEAETP